MKKYLLPYKNCLYGSGGIFRESFAGEKFYIIPTYAGDWNHYMSNGKVCYSKEEAKEIMDKVLIEQGWTLLPDKLKILL
jgi:hypothetical protein